MLDLSTNYMGFRLDHPVIASASPLSNSLDGIRRLEDAGAAAITLESLFEEQIDLEAELLDHYLTYGTNSFSEALNYFPEHEVMPSRGEEYLERIRKAKEVVNIPVIASLNGTTEGGWLAYAQKMEEAGASAIELNLYNLPTDIRYSAAAIEERYIQIVKRVKHSTSIPVAVKVSPFFSAPANILWRLARDGGANGLVLFNRFYQPDLDLETMSVVARLDLSHSFEMRLPMTWIAILHNKVPADFALTSGIHTGQDILKAMMAGAKVVLVASELLKSGLKRIREILQEVREWMNEHEYVSIRQMQGSMSQSNVADPQAFERANYMKVLHSFRTNFNSANKPS
ncbi:MAG: dihydroorotate dehydrogenase-like protein [Myxococcales bacterium]|nr:dihydroorotate dehydrogenase-like protein [Myxococcales bacterium]